MEFYDFARGDKVEHPVFGKGSIVDIYGDGEAMKVLVKFSKEIGEKKLAVKYAKLVKLNERARLSADNEQTADSQDNEE
jgi:hypothetical protein